MAGLFVGLACMISDVPQNHIVGFRFPWTMNITAIWNQTHNVGFWGMLADGVVCFVVTLLPIVDECVFGLGIGAMLFGIISPSLYTYWYARKKTGAGALIYTTHETCFVADGHQATTF